MQTLKIAAQMERLEAIRLDVTRERTGFALMPHSMTAAAYAADLAEAMRRLLA